MSIPSTSTLNNYHQQLSQLQQQNGQLQKIINQYIQQIDSLKKVNAQHQKEIQNLLKFNQRLLTIIEQEVNNNPNKNIQRSLQPISQVTQVDSQTMQQMMQSLQKTRTKIAARSDRGAPYRSQIDIKQQYNLNNNNYNNTQSLNNYNPNNNNYMNTLQYYLTQSKDLQRSQRYVPTIQKQQSQFGNKSSFSKKRQKKTNYNFNDNQNYNTNTMLDKQKLQFGSRQQLIDHQLSIQQLQRASTDARPLAILKQFNDIYQQNDKENQLSKIFKKPIIDTKQYTKIQQQITKKMNWQIQQMRKNSQMNHQFLDSKINQLNKLSKSINYNPEQKFNQLQNKIKLPPHLAALVKKAMVTKSK